MDKTTTALARRIAALDFARLTDIEQNAMEHWLAENAGTEHTDILLDASIRQGVEDKERAEFEASVPLPPLPTPKTIPAFVKELPTNLLTTEEQAALERTLRNGHPYGADESLLQSAAHRLLPKGAA